MLIKKHLAWLMESAARNIQKTSVMRPQWKRMAIPSMQGQTMVEHLQTSEEMCLTTVMLCLTIHTLQQNTTVT
jgi:hypothetical protein